MHDRRRVYSVIVSGLACLLILSQARAFTLAVGGKAEVVIVSASEATPDERTAVKELAEYLGKLTGGSFTIEKETSTIKGPAIYVGSTQFAKNVGIDFNPLKTEEWIVRTVGKDLILAGGRPRGTLYAVYHFLEDILGVHWWNPWEESLPSRPTIKVGSLDRHGKPVIRYRDIYMLYGHEGGRFAARNRLNREGDARIAKEYGGGMDYGPPYHVHTFYLYFPPATYFKDHPDWYSLVGGKRTSDYAQLCLTNPELRRAFLQKLKDYIENARAQAQKEEVPAPTVFSISQNDWFGACECDRCQSLAKAEESEAGPLLDFVNYMAEGIKDQYPEVYIDTLAYTYTQKAPKTVKPRDNVIIRLCDTLSNFTRSITDPENIQFREHLMSWARIAQNLRIWNYAVTYSPYYGLPLPTMHTYPLNYKFYAEHNVEGVFTEHEYPILADLRDLKVWMMIKMLEDPYQDYPALVKTFTDGFYGPAGKCVREYLGRLENASAKKISYLSMGASPKGYRYLDLPFIREATKIFDQAEKSVINDPTLLRRIRHARMPLDRATVILYPKLLGEWLSSGNSAESMPLNRNLIAERYQNTWHDQIALRLSETEKATEQSRADAEVAALTSRKSYVPIPEKFRSLPPGTVFDYTADTSRNYNEIVKMVPDTEAESGITNRLEFPTTIETDQHPVEKYRLPMPWGLYDVINKKFIASSIIKLEEVTEPGYHWYKMGTFAIGPSFYVYLFWSWIIQYDIDNAFDDRKPNQLFDIWARIKFEGPAFPQGKPDQKNAICVERLVLVKAR